ncbi:MAG: hypothetical protein ACQERZ_01550 [Fusobacteriota bacterium]
MVKPIDMQVIIKSVDQVAKTSKSQDNNPLAQQAHAKEEMAREIQNEMTTIREGSEVEDGIIDNKDEHIRKVKGDEKNNKKKNDEKRKKEKKKRKSKDRDRGKLIDLEG